MMPTTKHKLPHGLVHCKIGTMPGSVIFDRRGKCEIGEKIRFKEHKHGRWQNGEIVSVDPMKLTRL